MFKTARFKMTMGYVLIVMILSIAFSWGMYVILRQEVQRFAQFQKVRMQHFIQEEQRVRPPYAPPPEIAVQFTNPDLEEEALYRIQIVFIGLNIGILILATGLCYLLAGNTLAPIQTMVDEQRRFISDASHEFKTPLTSIRTTFEVALRNKTLSLIEAKQLIQENLREIENLQALNDALLKLDVYQKFHNGHHFEVLHLDQIVESAIRKITPLAKQKKITIHKELTPVSIFGDASQLNELVVILLDNAIKYSPKNAAVTIITYKERSNAQLKVTDSGSGIPESQLPHIFDRFYRVDTSRNKNKVAGYGLGLAIAQRIAELHHGKLSVESKVGQGSTFTFSLARRSSAKET